MVRIKPGVLSRVGLYLARAKKTRAVLLTSAGLPSHLVDTVVRSCADHGVALVHRSDINDATYEEATALVPQWPSGCDVVVGVGGGRALDVAKFAGSVADRPVVVVPTSLSNDGFASPAASLITAGRRRSFGCAMPAGVVVDTEVCLAAPAALWLSGVGDVVAKVTAIADWKLAFHARGTPIHDLAALLSDATVSQLMARPIRDLEGQRLLATALLQNGVAMALAGSSRPASGSEHLISHALDMTSSRPRLHGIQVGMAAYVIAALQGANQGRIATVLNATGFFAAVAADPFVTAEWLSAVSHAPTIKDDFYTVLTARPDATEAIADLIANDPQLAGCFR